MVHRIYSFRSTRSIFLSLLAVALVAAPVLGQAATIPVAQARQELLGTTVTVKGFVNSPSGAFTSWSFDQGFLISDGTAGIYVSVPEDLELEMGDQVEVTGVLQQSFNLLILIATAETVTEIEEEPLTIPTGSVSEATEGSLVTVVGTVTKPVGDDRPFGYRIFVDDGSGELQVFVDTKIDALGIPWLAPGQKIQVTGMSGEFDDHHELNPRIEDDIKKLDD